VRIISGSAKGRKLSSVPGKGTRPITARVKGALFSILMPHLRGAVLLDLFAGTGAVGIEALSRGAGRVVFVERAHKALDVLRHNLELTALLDRSELVHGDAFQYLARVPRQEQFDIIYVAPPQYRELWLKALLTLDAPGLLADDGLVVVQMHPKEASDVQLHFLEPIDERNYGSTMLTFYARRQRPAPEAALSPAVDERA
jgi:16S rRNA (guanine(966)-N(2))-methyltransferase RsmD